MTKDSCLINKLNQHKINTQGRIMRKIFYLTALSIPILIASGSLHANSTLISNTTSHEITKPYNGVGTIDDLVVHQENAWIERNASASDVRDTYLAEVNKKIKAAGGLLRAKRDAASGDHNALSLLGILAVYGLGQAQNTKSGVELLERASLLGNADAMFELAKIKAGYNPLVPKEERDAYIDKNKAEQLLTTSASLSNHHAMYLAGLLYLKGDVVVEDRDTGLFYLSQAASGGNKSALEIVSEVRLYKSRVKRQFDDVRNSANSGNVASLIKLADFYAEGWFVTRDIAKSKRLLTIARNLNSIEARQKLDAMALPSQ